MATICRRNYEKDKPTTEQEIVPQHRNTVTTTGSSKSELIQTHESILRETIQSLIDVIPEQYKMKIESSPNPVETQFLKDCNLHGLFVERNSESAILLQFDFDNKALDFWERKKLSSKLQTYFNNESKLPVYIHSLDGSFSKHVICVDDLTQLKKLQALYRARQMIKPKGTVQKAIPFIPRELLP